MSTEQLEKKFDKWIKSLGIKLTKRQYSEWFGIYLSMAIQEGFWF